MEKNQNKYSRGRKLVAMSLENEMSHATDKGHHNQYKHTSLGQSSTPNRDNDPSDIISSSELMNLKDLQIELPPITDSFLNIYQETQKLLLDTDPFQEYNFYNELNTTTTGVQDEDDPSFIENSSHEDLYFDISHSKRIKYSKNALDANVQRTITKPSITIPETPERSLEDFSLNKSMESIQPITTSSKAAGEIEPILSTNKKKTLKENKLEHNKKKHPLRSHCGYKCRKQCEQFGIKDREAIWCNYWNLIHERQLMWAARYIQLKMVKSRSQSGQTTYKRHETRVFSLPHSNGVSLTVCKKFFLNTLGYKNDSIVTTISKKLNSCPTSIITDKRGTNPKVKINLCKIKEFINLYNPCTAHYRRHNSPNMLYLSQDIGLHRLFQDFKKCYPTFVCGREVFRKTLKDMNISLRKPQNDKCYDCLNFDVNIKHALKMSNVPSLKLFCKEKLHIIKAQKATRTYKADSLKDDSETKHFSMDLQKTVLLPMIPDVKDCFFTNRLVAFNLTFCGLKKGSKEGSKCIVWHEATGGRDGKDMVDAVYRFLLTERDTKNFIFWADNCTAQNKNWILCTALVIIVNVHNIDSITIRYLTKGHTHMSADGVHGNIEAYLKKNKNVYDFKDYKQCIQKSRKDNEVIEVQFEDKFNWEKKKKASSQELKTFLLKDIVEVRFVVNKKMLYYKKSFDENHYNELDFIQKKFKVDNLPKKINRIRGIRSSKKKEILSKLVPIMPVNRQLFWQELPESDNVGDLIRDGNMVEDI